MRFIKVKPILVIAGFFLLSNVSCQNVNESYLQILKTKCDQPDITEIEKRSGYTEIEYLCNGKVNEIILNEQNHIISYETEAGDLQLTEQIYKKLNRNYAGWQVDEYSLVYFNDTSVIKVEIVKDGIEQNIYFTMSGKLYKPKSFIEAQKWSRDLLVKNKAYADFHFNLLQPDIIFELPEILNEISGISLIDDSKLLCVQDEIGSVFNYDLQTGYIVQSYRFSDVGDYEDVAYFKGKVFVLRSDGQLSSFTLGNYPRDIVHQQLSTQSLNIEGLTYDAAKGTLLFACHEANITSSENTRDIYSYNLKSDKKPIKLFTLTSDSIILSLKKKFPELSNYIMDFSPSALAVEPGSDNLFILSATDRILAVFTKTGNLKQIFPLPSDIFYKPEGIAFNSKGELLVSNEGTKNGFVKGNIVLLKLKK